MFRKIRKPTQGDSVTNTEKGHTISQDGSATNSHDTTNDTTTTATAGKHHLTGRPKVVHRHDDGTGKSKLNPKIKAAGESGRKGIDPLHFFRIVWQSTSTLSRAVNVLWPTVPAAIAVHYAAPDTKSWHLASFILAYLAMIPCANLIGFAGQQLARKVSHVSGVLIETTFGSVVELILFLVLITRGQVEVVKAAILGSILATLLLCLGFCFLVGGLKREEQTFSEVVSEAGSGLLLTAGFGLAVPTLFKYATVEPTGSTTTLIESTLQVSRITAILLIVAYGVYVWFQARSHHSIYSAIFEEDEERDHDAHKDAAKPKLTFTECILALVVSIALVALLAIALVEQIPFMVEERGISDPFLGLILVPLVEKAAEHLTAIDEAWDNQMNFALSHVLGATLQTALFNGPFIVLVGWGMAAHGSHVEMGLDFQILYMGILILAILTVGNFLRDQKSNYLEGTLCIIVYIIVAVAAFYSPTIPEGEEASTTGETASTTTATGEAHATATATAAVEAAAHVVARMLA